MKTFILFIFISINFSSFAKEASDNPKLIKETLLRLNYIRENFLKKDVKAEVEEFKKFVEENKIDLSEFGMGQGVYDFWKSKSLVELEKKYIKKCKKGKKYSTEFTDRVGLHNIEKEPLQISIVTMEDIEQLTRIMASKQYIPFDYLDNGCEARAHEMAQILDKMCINSGKAFLSSSGINSLSYKGASWQYHVAPFVLVEDGGKVVPYIIDPSVSGKNAMTLEEWDDVIGTFHSRNLTVTRKYIFMRTDMSSDHNKYRRKDNIKKNLAFQYFGASSSLRKFPDKFISFLKLIIGDKY